MNSATACDWVAVEKGRIKGHGYSVLQCSICRRETATVQGERVRPSQFACPFDVAEEVDTLVSALDDLRKLERQYEQQMSTLSTERIALEAQEDVLKRVKHDLSRDYTFAVEEIPEDSVECPICGTEHHNGFAARFGLAEDLGTTEDLLGEVRTKLADVRQSIADLRETLGSHRDEVRRVSTLLTEKKGEISK